MTKTIYAEELKKDDVIIIPASSHAGKRFFKIVTDPELDDSKMNCFGKRMRDANNEDTFSDTPMQFGRKVELELFVKS